MFASESSYKCKMSGTTETKGCNYYTDGNYAENGCEQSYNTFRPTLRSIMNRNRYSLATNGPTPFGPVNELFLCQEIMKRTTSVEGYCIDICDKIEENSGNRPNYCKDI